MKKEYSEDKPFRTIEEQADLLLEKGLSANKDELILFLTYNNYYRVQGYLYRFKNNENKKYENINLTQLKNIYNFDIRLRGLLLGYIGIFEVSFPKAIAYEMAKIAKSPFPHEKEYENLIFNTSESKVYF